MKSNPKLAAAVVVLALVVLAPTGALARKPKQKKNEKPEAQKTQAGQKTGAVSLVEVLEGPRDPDRLPSQLIQPAAGKLVWYVDRAAAARLSRSGEGGTA